MHLVLEVPVRWHVGHVEALSVRVELPTVVNAPNAVLLVPPEKQRRAAVWAPVVENAHAPAGVTESDQLFAQNEQAHRVTVGLDLGRHCGRDPILPHEFAHHRAGADPRQVNAVFQFHRVLLVWFDVSIGTLAPETSPNA
ncbi:hypothetical protein D3C87_1423990 [compost metagenome]